MSQLCPKSISIAKKSLNQRNAAILNGINVGELSATDGKRACSVKVWCTKITCILRILVQTGANLAVL